MLRTRTIAISAAESAAACSAGTWRGHFPDDEGEALEPEVVAVKLHENRAVPADHVRAVRTNVSPSSEAMIVPLPWEVPRRIRTVGLNVQLSDSLTTPGSCFLAPGYGRDIDARRLIPCRLALLLAGGRGARPAEIGSSPAPSQPARQKQQESPPRRGRRPFLPYPYHEPRAGVTHDRSRSPGRSSVNKSFGQAP